MSQLSPETLTTVVPAQLSIQLRSTTPTETGRKTQYVGQLVVLLDLAPIAVVLAFDVARVGLCLIENSHSTICTLSTAELVDQQPKS